MSFVWLVVYPVTKLMYNIKIVGRENVPKDSHVIYAANHVSYIDPPLVSLAARKCIAYMAKQELFKDKEHFFINFFPLLSCSNAALPFSLYSNNEMKHALQVSLVIATVSKCLQTARWLIVSHKKIPAHL